MEEQQPPERFGVVEPQLYRSSVFHPVNFTFISRLKLKTIVHLSPEVTMRAVSSFVQDKKIRLVHLGIKFWKPSGWSPISEELLKEALEVLLDKNNHPLMLMCTSGVHQTGTVVGCLRRLQQYSFSSIIGELRRYALPSHTRYANENLIEFFDVDLVNLPREENAPHWLFRQANAKAAVLNARREAGQSPQPAYKRYLLTNSGPLVSQPLKSKGDKEGQATNVSGEKIKGVKDLETNGPDKNNTNENHSGHNNAGKSKEKSSKEDESAGSVTILDFSLNSCPSVECTNSKSK